MIVKRAMKGRIRMELRISEVDKGSAARVTNTHEAGPFDELRDRLIPPIRSLAFRGKIIFPPITFILCKSREFRNTSSKEKADPSSAVLTLTHISFRAGCVSDGCTHSFIRN